MFEKIAIKSKEHISQKLNISYLVDAMLFYGQVIVLAHKAEIKTLLEYFGEDGLEELIVSGRIDIRIRENIIGSMYFPNGGYGIDLFSAQGETYSSILYAAHRSLYNNSIKNSNFAERFSKITQPFKYTADISEQIISDFENKELLKKLLPIYIDTFAPGFSVPLDLQIDVTKDKMFGPFDAYSISSNIDIDKLNEFSRGLKGSQHFDFNYSGFLLALSESKGDIFIASHFESELVTNKLYSDFITHQLKEIVIRRTKSQENIDLFSDYVLKDCNSLGDAFVNRMVSTQDILKLFENADKFREWLKEVPENKALLGEYYLAIKKETILDKLPAKIVRFSIFNSIRIGLDLIGAGGLGTAAALGISALDSFFLDKMVKGWKPNHFIDESLIPLTTP